MSKITDILNNISEAVQKVDSSQLPQDIINTLLRIDPSLVDNENTLFTKDKKYYLTIDGIISKSMFSILKDDPYFLYISGSDTGKSLNIVWKTTMVR